MESDDKRKRPNIGHILEVCCLWRRARSNGIKEAKAEHITAVGSENSGAGDELTTVKFLQIPAAPLVDASVSVTLTLYGPAGS